MSIISFDNPSTPTVARGLYDSGVTGTSDCNEYIPFYAVFDHNMLSFEGLPDVRVLEYSQPTNMAVASSSQYPILIQRLISRNSVSAFKFRVSGETKKVFVIRGMMWDTRGNILFSLNINTSYVLGTPLEEIQANPDPTKFILTISNEFTTNPEYRNLIKKVQTLYFNVGVEEGMDVVYTSRLNSWVFKNNYVEPSFRSAAALRRHLREEIPRILITP